MLAPVLDIVDLEAEALEICDGAPDIVELATREDLFRQRREFRPLPTLLRLMALARPRDGMVQEQAARPQGAVRRLEVGREVVDADMLESYGALLRFAREKVAA